MKKINYFLISAAPIIMKVSEKYATGILLHAGKSTIIEVPFTGAPQPKITWQFNGSKLPDPTRTTVETIYNMTGLTLNRVKRADAGTYSLQLENATGKATLSVKVRVIGK